MNPANPNPKGNGGYERPDARFRCGRGACWGKPCDAGPSHDGKCPQSESPCVPVKTLRARRGQIAWLTAALAVLLIVGGFSFGKGAKSRSLSADAGPLSAKHANFVGEKSCGACHAGHDGSVAGLLNTAFHGGNDMTAQCATCHKFNGPERAPHNENFPTHGGLAQTDCRQCHTEHRGATASLTKITDPQCALCHETKFASFAKHAPFAADFPARARGGIKFNHARHMGDYFDRKDFLALAPKDCAGCHVVGRDSRGVRTLGFEESCARCHAEQIPQTELALLRLPEPTATNDLAKLSADDATTFMAWIVQRGATNAADYGPKLDAWFGELAKSGVGVLAKSAGADVKLFGGLSGDLLARPLAAWKRQEKFEPASGVNASGWYWMEDMYPELHYKPAGHADAVARAWVEFALALSETNVADAKRAAQLRNEVVQPATGVGRCAKCHAVVAETMTSRRVDWKYPGSQLHAHTKFSHGAHVGLASCADCHAPDAKADYDSQFKDSPMQQGVSNFRGIALESCARCHAENKVRADCLLCHQYHRDSGLVKTPLQ